jgi:TnsA endonuclease N terminal
MARLRYAMTPAKLRRFLRERRGTGSGGAYLPWYTVRDVPSRGRSHRVACEKTGWRVMHLLSDHEYAAFLELWYDKTVTDIWEQCPLDLYKTLLIAGQLGIKHPVDSRTGVLLVQTTDLVATKQPGEQETHLAWAVKDIGDLASQRTLEKLEIERLYWEDAGATWQLVVNEGLNSSRTLNLAWLQECEASLRMAGRDSLDVECADRVIELVRAGGMERIGAACAGLDKVYGCPPGAHLAALRVLLYLRLVCGDLDGGRFSQQIIGRFEVKE